MVVCHVRDDAWGKQPARAPKVGLGHGAHGVLSQDGGGQRGIPGGKKPGSPCMDFRERYGMKVDGIQGPGELVRSKKNEKLGMGTA